MKNIKHKINEGILTRRSTVYHQPADCISSHEGYSISLPDKAKASEFPLF